MLKLKKISKSYKTDTLNQLVLKGINIEFRKNEFVSILGPSGSGKTTLLNIIGGLDQYDDGDLIINGKSTKTFSDKDWDAYRNNCVGFIFQSYNLINHISILDNVEMGMTLSGVNSKTKRRKALDALEKVGLKEHAFKKPNQLSGGQMQRVAIARAIVNNPDIILADEPTGALDSKTSKQILELIKDISKDKLVIMVTHNDELASVYSSRIINLKDGKILKDSMPLTKKELDDSKFKIRKTSMSFLTALKLSFNNIITKKGRTLLTAFASSIGIIGIALILSLSNGFDIQIDEFEQEALSSLPIMISKTSMELDNDTFSDFMLGSSDLEEYPDDKVVYPIDSAMETLTYKNDFDKSYVDYIENLDGKYVYGISYTRATSLNFISKINNEYKPVSTNYVTWSPIPKSLDNNLTSSLEENYDLLYGTYATNKEDIMLVIDSKNRINKDLLSIFGVDTTLEKISFNELVGKELKLILNNDYYISLGNYYTFNTDYASLYNSNNALTLKISGIVRANSSNKISSNSSLIVYTEDLVDYIIDNNKNSDIVKLQESVNYSVLTGEIYDISTSEGMDSKETMLSYLGADTVPMIINIYPRDFDSKDKILEYLDEYNKDKDDQEKVIYTDLASTISSLSGDIMNAVTIVLIAFSAISLIVSSIMIGIITYISVLERTKEIGILRALGARKKDITRVFNAETFIIGLTSGILGVGITYLILIPANIILENLTNLERVARLNPLHALLLITVSIILTLIGGSIPSKMASKKDPVIALRME